MLQWLKRLFIRRKPRIFLGELIIVSRSGLQKQIEFLFSDAWQTEKALDKQLTELISLPTVDQRQDPRTDDLVLDIVVTEHQSGTVGLLEIDDIPVPFGWRRKIKLVARVSNIDSNQPLKSYEIKENETWSQTISKELDGLGDIKRLFGSNPFEDDRLNELLIRACIKALQLVKNDI